MLPPQVFKPVPQEEMVANLVKAVQLWLTDMRLDFRLQAALPDCLDLCQLATQLRYKHVSEALLQLLAAHPVLPYDEATWKMQDLMGQLHEQLLVAHLAIMPSSAKKDSSSSSSIASRSHPNLPQLASLHTSYANSPRSVMTSTRSTPMAGDVNGRLLPRFPSDVVGYSGSSFTAGGLTRTTTAGSGFTDMLSQGQGLPPQLLDLQPVVLLDVDALLAPSVDAWIKRLGVRMTKWVDNTITAEVQHESKRWAPVSENQEALYSFSVVDLYYELQAVVDEVVARAMTSGLAAQRRSFLARQLHDVISTAVQRYILHLEQQCRGMLLAEPAAVAAAAAAAAEAAAAAAASTGGTESASTPPASYLAASGSVSEGSGAKSGKKLGKHARTTSTVASLLGSTAPDSGSDPAAAVISKELCVVVNNIQEVLRKQLALEKTLMQALKVSCSGT